MENVSGGQIKWVVDIDSTKFDQQLTKIDSSAKDFERSLASVGFNNFSSNASSAFGAVSSSANLAFKDIASDASASFGSIADGISNTVKQIAALTVGGGSLGAVFVKSAADLQQTSQSFKVLIGNTEVANKLFGQLLQYANATPFEFPQIAKAGQTLLGFGVQAASIQKILGQIGDVAGATGGDFESLALVTGQIFAQGKVQAQDFYQIINSRAGALGPLIAKNLGVNGVGALREQFERGTVTADAFFNALQQATTQGGFAFKGTNLLAQTFNGRLSTLKDTVLELGRNLLGVKVDPELGLTVKSGGVFDRLSKAIPRISQSLSEFAPKLISGFDFIIRNGETVKAIILGIAAAFVSARVAAIAFSIAASANPIGLIAAAIVALIGALTFLQLRFQIFTNAFNTLQPIIQPVINLFQTLFQVLSEQLAPLFDFIGRNMETLRIVGIGLAALLAGPLAVSLTIAIGTILAIVGAVTLLVAGWRLLISVATDVGRTVTDVFLSIHRGVVSAIGGVVDLFSGLGGRILSAIGNIGSILYRAGQSVIDGFIDGIKDRFGSVKNTLGDLTGRLTSWKGPEDVDRKVLVNNGRLVIGGFINGLESQYGAVRSTLSGLTSDIGLPGTQMAPDIASGQTFQGSNIGSSVEVNVNMNGIMASSRSDLRVVAKDLIGSVNEELRSRRLPEIGGGALA